MKHPWEHVDLGDLTGTATMEGDPCVPQCLKKKQNQLGQLYTS